MTPNDNVRLRLHLNAPTKPGKQFHDVGHQIPLQCDWQHLLSDVTTFGLVDVQVANPFARLFCTTELHHAVVERTGAVVNGPDTRLVVALRNLSGATIENGQAKKAADHVLRCMDWSDSEALRIRLTEKSAWSSFHAVLARQWAKRGAPSLIVGAPNRNVIDALDELQRQHASYLSMPNFADNWYIKRDGADAMPLCRVGQRVDPTLIVPFLEVIAEQTCRICLSVGNLGVFQRYTGEFYDSRIDGRKIKLRGSSAALELDQDGIAAASVVRLHERKQKRYAIRLFDERWRTIATFAAAPDEDHKDPWLWRTLINALVN